MVPEIEIWRAATLVWKRYGDEALKQSDLGVDELTATGDHDGADTRRRISAGRRAAREQQPATPINGRRRFA